MIRVEIPGMRLVSICNVREHRMQRARRTANQRGQACLLTRAELARQKAVQAALQAPWWASGGLVVLLTRIGPRRLDDDNCAAAFKAVRDGVAEALGIDDGDPRVSWRYAQHRRPEGGYGVVIEIGTEDGK